MLRILLADDPPSCAGVKQILAEAFARLLLAKAQNAHVAAGWLPTIAGILWCWI
jgi:hypothetical protein